MEEKKLTCKQFLAKLFVKVPESLKEEFEQDCIRRNLGRFLILPFLSIFTQISCIFIYLYVYPVVYPEKPHLNTVFYLGYTAVYMLFHGICGIAFFQARKQKGPMFYTRAKRVVDIYLLGYVLLEATQVIFELEISGNLYRFLATFAAVTFIPLLNRPKKIFFMTGYFIISQLSLLYLSRVRGSDVYSYPEIVLLVYIACVLAVNFYYSSSVDHFLLHNDLVTKNKQLQELNEELEYLSVTDALTKVKNRRAFSSYIELCWAAAIRSGDPVTILMLDIDWFKKYNDTYGHQMGDECLVRVATCVKEHFQRSVDMTARYGGEEFVVLLPHVEQASAKQMAEEVRLAVEAMGIPHLASEPYGIVTISVGIATHIPTKDESYETLLKEADDALYNAKKSGRNKVCEVV